MLADAPWYTASHSRHDAAKVVGGTDQPSVKQTVFSIWLSI